MSIPNNTGIPEGLPNAEQSKKLDDDKYVMTLDKSQRDELKLQQQVTQYEESRKDDLKKLEDGKYLYVLPDGKLDVDKFNRAFDQYIDKRKEYIQEQVDKRLDELNRAPPPIPIYKRSIGEIMVNTKDALFNTLDDVLQFKFESGTFTKDFRLFYIGLFIIIIAFIIFFYSFFVKDDKTNNAIEIRHTHTYNIPSQNYITNPDPIIQKLGLPSEMIKKVTLPISDIVSDIKNLKSTTTDEY